MVQTVCYAFLAMSESGEMRRHEDEEEKHDPSPNRPLQDAILDALISKVGRKNNKRAK